MCSRVYLKLKIVFILLICTFIIYVSYLKPYLYARFKYLIIYIFGTLLHNYYNMAIPTNNLSYAFRYKIYGNKDAEGIG